MRNGKQGFTIVEMLMVIGILAILMGIVTTVSASAMSQARSRRAVATKAVIQNGIDSYRAQQDKWPSDTLENWASEGISSDSANGVKSGRHIAFLSREQYDKMMDELVKNSVGSDKASPVMDVMNMMVAKKSDANAYKKCGLEFREAIKKNRKHGSTYKLSEMAFGYQSGKGVFYRYIVQYNADSDTVVLMTHEDFESWWGNAGSGACKLPSGYTKQ